MLAVTLPIILYQIPLACESSHIRLALSIRNVILLIEPVLPIIITSV